MDTAHQAMVLYFLSLTEAWKMLDSRESSWKSSFFITFRADFPRCPKIFHDFHDIPKETKPSRVRLSRLSPQAAQMLRHIRDFLGVVFQIREASEGLAASFTLNPRAFACGDSKLKAGKEVVRITRAAWCCPASAPASRTAPGAPSEPAKGRARGVDRSRDRSRVQPWGHGAA